MQRAALVAGEREVALDHRALGDGRVRREAELGADRPSCTWPSRESVGSSQWSASLRPVTAPYWSARRISPAEATGRPSSVKAAAPASASSRHLGQLLAAEPLRDRGHEAGRDERLAPRGLDERAEHGGRVDDRVGVRHRQDRAVAAGGGRGGAARDRLLVLAARASAGARADRRTPARARGRSRPRGSIRAMTPSSTVTATHSPPRRRPSSTRLSERPFLQKSVMRPPRAPAGRRAAPGAPPSARRGRSGPARGSASRAASATRPSISTPRLIGPGCITFWPGRSRSGVIPQRAAYSRRLGTKADSIRSRCMRRT